MTPDSATDYWSDLQTPVGKLRIHADAEAITAVEFADVLQPPAGECIETKVIQQAKRELKQYFAWERTGFTLPLNPQGTEFQQEVWNELMKIPFGETRSYMDIAKQIGKPDSIRAVGAANGKNPIAIIIPCHRVIGSDGKLVGYGGGIDKKVWLLKHERAEMLI